MGAALNGFQAIEQVRWLLGAWASYRKRWRPDNGLPRAVAWIDEVRGCFDGWTEGADYDAKIYAAEMSHVDQAINNLSSDHQHAINVVYLNEIGPAVWRSAKKPMKEIRQLCDAAETALVPVLKRRDLIL